MREQMASPGCDLSEVRHPQGKSDTSAFEDKAGGRKPYLGTSVGLGVGQTPNRHVLSGLKHFAHSSCRNFVS